MSLLPLLLHNHSMLNEQQCSPTLSDLYHQNFGLGLENESLPARAIWNIPALRAGYLRPWRHTADVDSGVSTIKSDDNEFTVGLDVTHFKPEELTVKVDDRGYLVVEGKHEERSDEHGFIARQFTRRYELPDDVVVDSIKSNLSSDGVLTLQAAKKPKPSTTGREIKIIRTNLPAVNGDKETNGMKMDKK
uniref:Heat shock protein 20-1 n=1 Tax=Cyrtorhinus lividipennis TaxID=1032904 RepID=A0A346THM9_9HEMI|nr:heat shock protein 20-1 [Cyrtorhinus lividipennis]